MLIDGVVADESNFIMGHKIKHFKVLRTKYPAQLLQPPIKLNAFVMAQRIETIGKIESCKLQ